MRGMAERHAHMWDTNSCTASGLGARKERWSDFAHLFGHKEFGRSEVLSILLEWQTAYFCQDVYRPVHCGRSKQCACELI